ncbi:MAG: DUF362 domain-containing protein [Candidatus Aminicenantes bacterium]|nr:DUF362 domain-containing protein [Candidatus Aminicenantes bacterium]
MAKVALIKTSDRRTGVREAMQLLDFPGMKGKSVLLKPNFNTSDSCPGSTHNDTLSELVKQIHERGAKEIILGERSGPPDTEKVIEEKGIFQMSKDLDFEIVNFEKIQEEDWVHFNPEGNHWEEGFYIARPAAETEYFVSTCCLKTHQYGGVFTLSLKLAVGLTPKRLMRELHGKRQTDMRKMIAEINLGYKPHLIILDGVEGFVDGGPSKGEKKTADIFLASSDRIALDAAGVAVLKELGSNEAIMGTKIFEQEQIERAVELNMGIANQEQIEFVTPDRPSRLYAEKLKSILAQG